MNDAERQALVPGYETDLSAVGTNRTAESPDDGVPWYEVHGLTESEAAALVEGIQP